MDLVKAGRVDPAVTRMINLGELSKRYNIPISTLLKEEPKYIQLMFKMS